MAKSTKKAVVNETAERFDELRKFYEKMNLRYSIVETGQTLCLQTPGGLMAYKDRSGGLIPQNELFVFGMVDRDAKAFLNTGAPFCRLPRLIPYGLYDAAVKEGSTEELIQIDIRAAYPTAAKALGIVSPKTYGVLTSERISKPTRLAALGSLATRKRISDYKGETLLGTREERKNDGQTAPLFFETAAKVGGDMRAILEKTQSGAAFFWVDAFFCRPGHEGQVSYLLQESGYQYRQMPPEVFDVEAAPGDDGAGAPMFRRRGAEPGKGCYTFSRRWADCTYNRIAKEEAALFERIQKIAARATPTDRRRRELVRAVCRAYGTSRIEDINMVKVLGFLKNTGLSYTDYLRVRETAKETVNLYFENDEPDQGPLWEWRRALVHSAVTELVAIYDPARMYEDGGQTFREHLPVKKVAGLEFERFRDIEISKFFNLE